MGVEDLFAATDKNGTCVSEFGTRICDSNEAKVFWYGQRGMIGCDAKDEDRLVCLRAIGGKLRFIDAGGDLKRVSGMQSTCMDTHDGFRIYFPPTRLSREGVSITDCKRKMKYTASQGFLLRVAVVFDESTDYQVDGVDMGTYKAVEYTEGKGNFLILERHTGEREEMSVPAPSSVSKAVSYEGYVYRSHQEARVAVLMNALGIPFLRESEVDMRVHTLEGQGYDVDFLIYPSDKDLVAYLEVKPYKPHRGEIMKAVSLFQRLNIPVFIVWGSHFVQAIGVSADKTMGEENRRRPAYTDGICGMKIQRGENGEVGYEEGYYFMTSDLAEGGKWEEVEEETASLLLNGSKEATLPIRREELIRNLDAGRLVFGKGRRERLGLTRAIRKKTCLFSPVTKKYYRPKDGLRPYLYKDSLEATRGKMHGAAGDPFTAPTKEAFALAEGFVFDA